MSSTATAALPAPAGFSGEMTTLYAKMAEQHRHPQGPWAAMIDAIKTLQTRNTTGNTGNTGGNTGGTLRILDAASGQGEPAISMAREFLDHEVVSTDISPDMVNLAESTIREIREKNPGLLHNIAAQQADLQALAFEDASFDVVTVCYGFMFPPDKQKAVDEAFRVLKPGGTLVATTWDRLDLLKVIAEVMGVITGTDNPEPPAMNPMSLSEDGLFEGMLQRAGFSNLAVSRQTYPFDLGDVESEKSYQFNFGTRLIHDRIVELGAEKQAEEVFWKSIPKYSVVEKGNLVMPENTFKLTVAKKP